MVLLHCERAHLVFQGVLGYRAQSSRKSQRNVLTWVAVCHICVDFLLDNDKVVRVDFLEFFVELEKCNASSVLVVAHNRVVQQHGMHLVRCRIVFATARADLVAQIQI